MIIAVELQQATGGRGVDRLILTDALEL